jgi:hypothetical protein
MFLQVRPANSTVARRNRSMMDETFDADIYVSDVDKLATEVLSEQVDIVEGPTRENLSNARAAHAGCNGYVLVFGQG